MAEQILNTQQACQYLGVSYWTLTNKLIKEIPHIRMTKRGHIKFKQSTLDKYLEEQEKKSKRIIHQDFIFEQKEESITELREKYNKKNKSKTIQEIMQNAKAARH